MRKNSIRNSFPFCDIPSIRTKKFKRREKGLKKHVSHVIVQYIIYSIESKKYQYLVLTEELVLPKNVIFKYNRGILIILSWSNISTNIDIISH